MLGRLSAFLAALAFAHVFGFAGGPEASALAADAGTAVLGIEAIESQDNALANEITEAIKQRVAAGKGAPLVPGKDLVEIKLVFSCADDQADCLAQAGKSLGAAKLIYGNVKRSGGEIVLSLKQIDVARGVIEGSTVETLPKKKSDPSALRALSTQWIARLGGGKGAGGTAPGTLIVRSNVVGAVVMLDGAQVGTLTRKALQIDEVAPGKHEISVEKPGYGITTQQFTVGAGQALPLTLTLGGDGIETNPAGGEAEAGVTRQAAPGDEGPPQDSLRTWARTGFWVGLGLSAVSFGLAAKYGFDVHSINNELDPFRKPGHVGELSPSEQTIVNNKLEEGNRAETRQWIFIGVGSAAAVAGGFLLYKGYLDKETGVGPKTADNHGLRVFPTANSSSGGVAAEFEF